MFKQTFWSRSAYRATIRMAFLAALHAALIRTNFDRRRRHHYLSDSLLMHVFPNCDDGNFLFQKGQTNLHSTSFSFNML